MWQPLITNQNSSFFASYQNLTVFLPISNCIEIEMEIVIDACPEKKLDLYESKISLQLFFFFIRTIVSTHISHSSILFGPHYFFK